MNNMKNEKQKMEDWMIKHGYTLVGSIKLVAWGILEGTFRAKAGQLQRVQLDSRDTPNQMVFVKG